MDIQEAFEAYLHERVDLAESSVTMAKISMRLFRAWFLQTTGDELTLSNWTGQDTRQYMSHLLNVQRNRHGEHLKPATVNAYISHLKTFCNWCVDQGYIERNPLARIKSLKQSRKSATILDRN